MNSNTHIFELFDTSNLQINIKFLLDRNTDLNINNIDNVARIISKKIEISDHKLFSQIKNRKIIPSVLGTIMAPFYFAVYNWLEHLEKLRKKMEEKNIPNSHIELISENINDEKGYDGQNQSIDKCHTTTYVNFLNSLGFKGKLNYTKAVIDFNSELDNILETKDIAYNAAVLAGIEYFYIEISSIISNYCNSESIKQNHYELHEVLDYKHASDLFELAKKCNATFYELLYGMAKGYSLLWNVFNNLNEEYLRENLDVPAYGNLFDFGFYY
ncbi:heme oxygenase [Tupanvirus soda lake]|uniref:Heme oxygenase n=2 Tax=Tupanvirus TaxID=2094720 RepID=A0A6N1NK11_9VIRU|nr:heme oxygenase [Tupanvirus soda lake]QKU35109.1 heme oxygenase [Tupanvirus soda lake]